MYNTDFSDDQPVERKRYYSHEVECLSKPSAMASPESYEFFSRQRAMFSRNIIGELEEQEAFVLFFYGRYGLAINISLRLSRNIINTIFKIKDLNRAQELVTDFRKKYSLEKKESVRKIIGRNNEKLQDDLIRTNFGGYAKAFRMAIDDIIEKYSSRFTKDNALYRIVRVQKTAYTPPSETLNPKSQKITTGDIIMDRALWSTASQAENAIYRYSAKGQSVTHKSSKSKLDTEEEVLFIIENNEHLKAIDISGYKFSKKREGRTSGELLIKSHTKFKVIGIQKSEPRLDRRIVILEPVSDESLKPSDAIKNPYNGEIYDPATLHSTSLIASTSSPKTDTTSGATASTSAIETEVGAVGGATGTSIPEPFTPWEPP